MWISKEEDDAPRPTIGVSPRRRRNCFQALEFEALAEFVESALAAAGAARRRGAEIMRVSHSCTEFVSCVYSFVVSPQCCVCVGTLQ